MAYMPKTYHYRGFVIHYNPRAYQFECTLGRFPTLKVCIEHLDRHLGGVFYA